MTLNELIVDEAMIYLGKKETPGNSGFQDPEFQRVMTKMGWKPGQSWCDYLAELVYKGAYYRAGLSEIKDSLSALFAGGAVASYRNFKNAGWKISNIPVVGALVIFQKGGSWHGHIGIVTETGVMQNGIECFKSIEGNTSEAGSREGTTVREQTRVLYVPNVIAFGKLQILGFVHPKS